MFRRKNKKASILDFIYIMIALLGLALSMMVVYKFLNSWNNNLAQTDVADDYGKAASLEVEGMMSTTVDNSYLLLVIGLCIIAMFLASMTYFHPVFFILFIIIAPTIIILGGIFSNIYQTMAESPEFAELASKLVFTSMIMKYLPIIIGVVGFILAVIMYSKGAENR